MVSKISYINILKGSPVVQGPEKLHFEFPVSRENNSSVGKIPLPAYKIAREGKFHGMVCKIKSSSPGTLR